MTPQQFSKQLLQWYDIAGRHDLPWQAPKTPYRVWVSEIMLQQTQVKTVLRYFTPFMQAFPTVEALAHADQDTVLAYWSGLGYYARGRHLHQAAQTVVFEKAGQWPQTLDQWQALPGVGRSTACAIMSITQNRCFAILDGNVKRVLARLDGIDQWPGQASVEKALWQRAQTLMQTQRCGDYTQAIMDLGASVCTRTRPKCDQCPVANACVAKAQNLTHVLPRPKPKKIKPTHFMIVWVLQRASDQAVYLIQKPARGIWGGLWSLPEARLNKTQAPVSQQLRAQMLDQQAYAQALSHLRESLPATEWDLVEWPSFKHTFTHYHLWVTPIVGVVPKDWVPPPSQPGAWDSGTHGAWVALASALERGLPAPVKQVLKQLERDHGKTS